MALKKQAQDARNNGKLEHLESWLKQEFNLYVNIVEAEATLKVLLEDRDTLQVQLVDMKTTCGSDSSECKFIEEDLELKSVQINDLEQKLSDSNEENRLKIRFDKFQTMSEAKFGIKCLFAKAEEIIKEKVNIQIKLSELQEIHKETQEKLQETKKSSIEEVTALQNKYEEKVARLLKKITEMKEEKWILQIEELKEAKRLLEEKL